MLGDDEEGLATLVREAAQRCAVIVITGGLGPTLDDVTRHALARAAEVELVEDAASALHLREWFESRGRAFAESNRRQALFPRTAEILPNPVGTAPGFCIRIARALVFALPGPPREMLRMLEDQVLPRVEAGVLVTTALARASFYLLGLPESGFADRAGAWMERTQNPLMGVTAHYGVLSVSLAARAEDCVAAERLLAQRVLEFRERFAEWIFSESDADPARALAALLFERELSVSVAESCTGGLVAAHLTNVPGISAVFGAGFVTYANQAKSALVGVEPALLAQHGAVSAPVAEAMARGAARAAGARCAVSVTGVAGPDGGSPQKPVGLVWFATAVDGAVHSEERRFALRDRELIREFAANTALDLLRRAILKSAAARSSQGSGALD